MLEWLSSSWDSIWNWLPSWDWACLGVWSLTISLLVIGMLGSLLPILPGPMLLFLAGLIHTWLRPESAMSIWGIIILAVLLAAAYALDFMSGAMGAKWFGASRWGIAGVLVGGVVGFFFSLPGLIVGPIIGGLVFEILFAKKEIKLAAKSTWGTVVGTGLGLIARLAVSLVMVAVFFIDALWW